MNILNNLTIKYRVLFLTLVPLVALFLFSYFKVEYLMNEIKDISSVNVNLQIGKKLFSNIAIMDKIRLASLHNQSIKFNNERQRQWKLNNQFMKDKIPKLVALTHKNGRDNKNDGFGANIGEIELMVNDIKSYHLNNIDNAVEWSEVSFDDLIFEALGYLEKMHLHSDSSIIDQKLHVILQLRLIMFYTYKKIGLSN